MHPHEHPLLAGDVAVHQRDMLGGIHIVLVADDAEFPERRGQPRFGDAMHQPLVFQPIGNELSDGDEREAVLRGEALEIGATRHGAIRV